MVLGIRQLPKSLLEKDLHLKVFHAPFGAFNIPHPEHPPVKRPYLDLFWICFQRSFSVSI